MYEFNKFHFADVFYMQNHHSSISNLFIFTDKILLYSQHVSVISLPSSGGYQMLNRSLQYMDVECLKHPGNLSIIIKIYS
jgi:hypothetical protein